MAPGRRVAFLSLTHSDLIIDFFAFVTDLFLTCRGDFTAARKSLTYCLTGGNTETVVSESEVRAAGTVKKI